MHFPKNISIQELVIVNVISDYPIRVSDGKLKGILLKQEYVGDIAAPGINQLWEQDRKGMHNVASICRKITRKNVLQVKI